jgi:phage terminase large subunit
VDVLLRGGSLPDGAVVVKTTYADNPWLPDVLRRELEWDQRRDPEKYAHIWLGEYERKSEARVFKNWTPEAFETPSDARFLFGADWGFSTDPTVLVRCWIRDRTLYVDAEVYRVGCDIDLTPALFDTLDKGMARRWDIVADSARPETISYMQRHGYPKIKAARKGPGSVEEGVTFLQSYDIKVHPRCRHAIDELTLYSYKTDPLTGAVLPVLEDKKNHVIDALRYAVEGLRAIKPAFAAIQAQDTSWQRTYFQR